MPGKPTSELLCFRDARLIIVGRRCSRTQQRTVKEVNFVLQHSFRQVQVKRAKGTGVPRRACDGLHAEQDCRPHTQASPVKRNVTPNKSFVPMNIANWIICPDCKVPRVAGLLLSSPQGVLGQRTIVMVDQPLVVEYHCCGLCWLVFIMCCQRAPKQTTVREVRTSAAYERTREPLAARFAAKSCRVVTISRQPSVISRQSSVSDQ